MSPRAIASSLVICIALLGCDAGGSEDDAGGGGDDAGMVGADAATSDAGPPADTWTAFANDFMQTYCVECHATSPKDFELLSEVRANAATIRCGVSDVALSDCGSGPPPRQFPIGSGPFPSDEDRARLVAWLDAGAPE
ncbi:MAG: hypothetical protein H6719_18895 [Sandaracinaceae bacterium]|nr:hypothetical protein [Sandaracinaceae bacterium]